MHYLYKTLVKHIYCNVRLDGAFPILKAPAPVPKSQKKNVVLFHDQLILITIILKLIFVKSKTEQLFFFYLQLSF